MRQRLFIVFSIFLCALLSLGFVSSLAGAQEVAKEQKNIITTNGEAKIWIEPDRARVYLGIETLDENVALARDKNAESVKKVMAALESLKIKEMLTKAPSYSVLLVKENEHDATRSGRLPKILGYKVRQDFTVLLTDKDPSVLSKNSARVIDTALDNGVNMIQNVEFFKEDDSQDKRKALALAVESAIDNAKAIAKTAGVTIKNYTMINSHTSYWQPSYRNTQMMQQFAFADSVGGSASTTIVAGKIAVSANVTISCSIE